MFFLVNNTKRILSRSLCKLRRDTNLIEIKWRTCKWRWYFAFLQHKQNTNSMWRKRDDWTHLKNVVNLKHESIFQTRSQSYQTLISLFFRFSLLSLSILKNRQYFLVLQTIKLNNKKRKKIHFTKKKVW